MLCFLRPQSGRDPLQALLAMQLLENMKDKKRLKHKKSKRDSSQSASSSESNSDESDSSSNRHRLRGHAKAVETYQSSKKRMFRRPLKHVRKYVREVEKDLGAENRAYHLSEIGKKINWGKQKSLQRCHYMLSDILTKLLKGQTEKATLQTVSLFEVNTSGSIGQRLEHCMASVPFAGSMDQATMGRRSGRSWKRHGIFEEHGRAESKRRSSSKCQQLADRRFHRCPGRGQEEKGQGQRQGEGRGQNRVKPRRDSAALHPSLDRQLRRQFLDGLWCY